MLMKNEYLLKVHECYEKPVNELKEHVKKLRKKLSIDDFKRHPDVKFTARLRKASLETIPKNPDEKDYKLHGNLRKFRRYKQGLKRYRMFFSFSNTPPIILYLYLNDKSTLRKAKDKNNPYEIFSKKVEKGEFSSDPSDPKIQEWIKDYLGQ